MQTMTRGERRAIEAAIEALIAVLDAVDGNSDDEEGGDIEPSIGWPSAGYGGDTRDCELNEVAA